MLKIGDKVKMNGKYHVNEANREKVWTARVAEHDCEMLKAVQKAISSLPHWISVEEGLPERYTDVAIIEREGVHWWYKVAYLGACDVWALNGGHRVLGDVTHWMPLPEPPEEGATC